MRKILAYVGSQKGKSSNTYILVKMILDKAMELCQRQVSYEILTAKELMINPCKSCNNCFYKGECSLDKADDMKAIKSKLLEADLIIFGSAVFFHQVTSDMKLFIDRIAYWSHLLRLAGKPAVVVSTSSSNGNEFVDFYLKKVMNSLGMKVIANCSCTIDYPAQLDDQKFIENEVIGCARIISSYIDEKEHVNSTHLHEALFQSFKLLYSKQKEYQTAEYKFWKENGYFNCDSYTELLQTIKRNNF